MKNHLPVPYLVSRFPLEKRLEVANSRIKFYQERGQVRAFVIVVQSAIIIGLLLNLFLS